MLYTYKLPNGVLRLSDKAEYYADAADAYHNLAKVILAPHLQAFSCSRPLPCDWKPARLNRLFHILFQYAEWGLVVACAMG